MRARIIRIILGLILLGLLALALANSEGAAADDYHLLLYPGDNAYILCANSQLSVTINGADTIMISCLGRPAPEPRLAVERGLD